MPREFSRVTTWREGMPSTVMETGFVRLFYRDVTNTGVTIMRSFQQHNRSTG